MYSTKLEFWSVPPRKIRHTEFTKQPKEGTHHFQQKILAHSLPVSAFVITSPAKLDPVYMPGWRVHTRPRDREKWNPRNSEHWLDDYFVRPLPLQLIIRFFSFCTTYRSFSKLCKNRWSTCSILRRASDPVSKMLPSRVFDLALN